MILGYSTNAFVRYDLGDAVDRIGRAGFAGVEIMCDRPHLYPPDYGPEKLDRIRGVIEEKNLRVTNLNSFTLFAVGDTYLPSWIEPAADRREIRTAHTRNCLQIARALGCPNISIPPGGPLNGISRAEGMSLFHRGLEAVIPMAEELGIRLLVEPEPDLLIERTSEFREFIRDIRSPAVGLNFDIGHFFCAGEKPEEAFEELFEWIGHVHLEDIGRSRIHQHLVPGDGAIDLAAVFRAMKRLGYTGDITLELYPYVHLPGIAGRRSLDHLRPIFSETELDIA